MKNITIFKIEYCTVFNSYSNTDTVLYTVLNIQYWKRDTLYW